ncbi:MAG TPA: hypothetical protein VM598_04590, partial [Bdellovibrionota bacterium]|nr:hypothetical protein [Bdellovibrionota bacterium]
MEQANCTDCRKPGASTQCGVCTGALCKKCRLFLGDEEYPFASERPPELKHTYYCRACHAQHVEPFAEAYASTLE